MRGLRLLRQLRQAPSKPFDSIRSFATASAKSEKPKGKSEKIEIKPKATKTNGYQVYVKEASAKLKKLNLPIGELSKQLAKEWAAASDETRKKYADEAMRLNSAFSAKASKTRSSETKRASNPYAEFVKTVYPSVKQQYGEKSFGELSKIISVMWKNIPEAEKAKRKAALRGM